MSEFKEACKELQDVLSDEDKAALSESSSSDLLETLDWMRGRIEEYEETLNKDAYLLRRADMQMETLREVLVGMREREDAFDGKFDAEHQARIRAETTEAALRERIAELEAIVSNDEVSG